jgi:bacterioferritin-associated ferredoxin
MMRVELQGQDWVDWNEQTQSLQREGCLDFLQAIHQQIQNHGKNPSGWQIPQGKDHVSLLISELILKARGQWKDSYTEKEICHCRNITTEKVRHAVYNGAHVIEDIRSRSGANTACGTCRDNIMNLVQAVLDKGQPSK